jgi:hypothetical protein
MASVRVSASSFMVGSSYVEVTRNKPLRLVVRACVTGGSATYLVVDALVEEDAQRPPIGANVVTVSCVDLWREVGERARLACQDLAWYDIGCNILVAALVIRTLACVGGGEAYKIR